MIHYIESSQLIDEVLKSNKLVIVDFFATWCMPCTMMSEVLHEVEEEYQENVEIFKIDVDENQDVEMRYGVTAMPTLVFFRDGKEIDRRVGFLEKSELSKLIEELMN